MTSAEILSELRAARPVAREALRERIAALAATEPASRPSLLDRLRPRRLALVVLPVAGALALATAGAIGLERSSREPQLTAESGRALDGAAQAKAQRDAAAPPVSGTESAQGLATAPSPSTGRAQRYSAALTLEVADNDALSDATQRALETARSLGGYVVSVSFATEERGAATMTLRLPTEKVQDAIVRLSALGTIVAQQVQIDDLQETIDAYDERIAALRERIARLSARLTDGSLTDETRSVLRSRLDAARTELGQLRAARSQTAGEARFATVTLALRTPEGGAAASAPSRFDRALDEAVAVLTWEGIALLYVAIVAAPFAVVAAGLLVARRMARRRQDERLLAAS